ncbi:MAG: LptF/LptG family permease [Phycisphaerales bacterium]|nr:LptF/LptG family permease [Phycisphaerales bacterium]
MPWRLHGYLAADLLRIIGLTTAVLVVVTAFGAIIKPLSSGMPLGAAQAATFVALSTIPMLQYVLPFAAGFATTLVVHRLVTDNEVLAMAAAGLSYRTILTPVIAMAVVLSVGLTVLANTVIPRVHGVMASVLAGDMIQMLEHSVDTGRPMRLGSMQIWAEGMRVAPAPNGQGQRVQLDRVAAAQTNRAGAMDGDVSARGAVLDFVERDGVLEVQMVLEDAVSWDAGGGGLRGFPRIEPTHPIRVPLPQRSEPAAMTRSQLLAADADPSRYPAVADAMEALSEALDLHFAHEVLNTRLADGGVLTLSSKDDPGHTWEVQAQSLQAGRLTGGPDGVEVRSRQGDEASLIFRPKLAAVVVQGGTLLGAGDGRSLVLTMGDVEIQSPQAGIPPNHRAAVQVANLQVNPPLRISRLQGPELVKQGQATALTSPAVAEALGKVDAASAKLHGQVESRLWRRTALGATAGLLPLLGAVLALLMRGAQPLTVYMVGFIPGLLDLVFISGGTGTIRHGDPAMGLIVMWSGSALLLVAIVVAWCRVRRN